MTDLRRTEFTCDTCGASFQIPEATLARFPGWEPRECLPCKKAREQASDAQKLARARVTRLPPALAPGEKAKPKPRARRGAAAETRAADLAEGPGDGCYTDGSAQPNPGPGGWGVVWVVHGQVAAERSGGEARTTNNRMELTALIQAYRLSPAGVGCGVWTDSQLCVRSMLEWAPGWARNGWKRKTGPIQNLDLVQELYALVQSRPELQLGWLRGHAGTRWNEYADELATAATRLAAGRG
ncbi:MAG TPA: ribonuclease H [Myxococcota bacterium]|nr:ribonuclease H [Myxococcota bacterium]HRY92646.1 ribonuclease H [Myxococcota bacterium]HSA22813.1 ribonuclease H [Myxococcota bacterium]